MASQGQEYLVRKGDTLEQVAREVRSTRDWKAIWSFRGQQGTRGEAGQAGVPSQAG